MNAATADAGEHRTAPRQRVLIPAKIRFGGGATSLDCVVRNLSDTGAKLQLSPAVSLPAHFDLVIAQRNAIHRCELRWRTPEEAGVTFVERGPAAREEPADTTSEEALRRRVRFLEAEVARLQMRIRELAGM